MKFQSLNEVFKISADRHKDAPHDSRMAFIWGGCNVIRSAYLSVIRSCSQADDMIVSSFLLSVCNCHRPLPPLQIMVLLSDCAVRFEVYDARTRSLLSTRRATRIAIELDGTKKAATLKVQMAPKPVVFRVR